MKGVGTRVTASISQLQQGLLTVGLSVDFDY